MHLLDPSDIVSVEAPQLAGGSIETLSTYSLALGSRAAGLYAFLWSLPKAGLKQIGVEGLCKLAKADTLSLSESLEDLGKAGLARIYRARIANNFSYKLMLSPLPSPAEAAVDPFLLLNTLGKGKAAALLKKILASFLQAGAPEGYDDVTPSPEEPAEKPRRPDFPEGNNPSFSRSEFRARYEQNGKDYSLLSEAELSRLENKVYRLYPLKEEEFADICARHVDEKQKPGRRLDFAKIIGEAANSSSFRSLRKKERPHGQDNRIENLERMKSEDFLLALGGKSLASPDRALISRLRRIGLPDSVINALLSYVDVKEQGSLPAAYVEKIAGTLARNHITSGGAAWDYLSSYNRGRSLRKKDDAAEEAEETEGPEIKPAEKVAGESAQVDEENIDPAALIAKIKGRK